MVHIDQCKLHENPSNKQNQAGAIVYVTGRSSPGKDAQTKYQSQVKKIHVGVLPPWAGKSAVDVCICCVK